MQQRNQREGRTTAETAMFIAGGNAEGNTPFEAQASNGAR